MTEIVSTQELKLGMFVAELDRPWLETPFLVQGFLLDDDEQLATLRELCRFVTIDRARSIGEEYRPDVAQHFVAEKRRPMAPREPIILYQSRKNLTLPPLAVAGKKEIAGRKFTTVSYVDDIHVEEELPAARVSYQSAQNLLRDLDEQVATGNVPDIDHVDRTVTHLVECVVRNPDALLWLSKLKRTDNQIYDHSLTVSIHLMAFGRNLSMPPDELHPLGMGGLLKDIGIMRLPLELLHKPSGLTPDEKAHMRTHVDHGTEMLADEITLPEDVRDIVAKHHERIDGSGYPRRLVGDQIGLYAEMAGIVDSYCAMLSPRPFRPARLGQWVIEEINSMRNIRFTAAVVDEFVQFVGLYPVGTLVELNSGEVGVVVEQNRVRRLKPRIMLLLGPDKTRNSSPGILNLLSDPLVRDGVPYRILRDLPPGSFGLDPTEFYL
jgi:putative nucleotidyltransferase with HDIG domain